jgi:hypothetical protein
VPEIQMDEFEFERRYRPIVTETGAWRDFDWTDPEEKRLIDVACSERRIWTTVDDGSGFVMLVSGWHFVNRLGYVVTEVPFESERDDISVYDPEDLAEYESYEARLERGEFD